MPGEILSLSSYIERTKSKKMATPRSNHCSATELTGEPRFHDSLVQCSLNMEKSLLKLRAVRPSQCAPPGHLVISSSGAP